MLVSSLDTLFLNWNKVCNIYDVVNDHCLDVRPQPMLIYAPPPMTCKEQLLYRG